MAKKAEISNDRTVTATKKQWGPLLSALNAANNKPVTVTRETTIQRARTLMLMHDLSQLPVLNGERTVHGMISWKSLGRVVGRRFKGSTVADFMDEKPRSLRSTTPLVEAIPEIIKHEVVLVRGVDRTIVGI